MGRLGRRRHGYWAAALSIASVGGAIEAKVPDHRKGFPYAPVAPDNAKCLLSVNGRSRIDGPCLYTPEGGGSFEFDDNKGRAFCYHRENDCSMAETIVTRDGYFGMLDVGSPGIADAHWNAGQGLHAQDDLGMLHRTGACWTSVPRARPRVKLCVWR
jgi:hypothetical protein